MENKKIKANEANLLKALKECAKAHNADFEDWRDEGQIGIGSTTPATIADVNSIVGAFAKNNTSECVECGYGYVTIWVGCIKYKKVVDGVDRMCLDMALPYGVTNKIKWQTL